VKDKVKNEKGIAMVMVVFVMVVIIGFAALAVDFGNAAVRKSRLQNACDAAALAGAYEWAHEGESDVISESEDIFEINISDNISVPVAWSEDGSAKIHAEASMNNGEHTVTVKGKEIIDTYLASLIGMDEIEINAEAVAIYGPARSIEEGLRPFAIDDEEDHSLGTNIDLVADDGITGNYYFLRPDGQGTSDLEDAILIGSTIKYSVGDTISTEPGSPSNPVGGFVTDLIDDCEISSDSYIDHNIDGHKDTCPRIIICPLIDYDTFGGGTSDEVLITGFVSIFINEVYDGYVINETGIIVRDKPEDLSPSEYKKIKDVIEGKFIETLEIGEVDWTITYTGQMTTDLIK